VGGSIRANSSHTQEQVAEANGLRQINEALEDKVSQTTFALESMRREQATAWAQWNAERDAILDALREAKTQGDR
jgi:hypothetical protein